MWNVLHQKHPETVKEKEDSKVRATALSPIPGLPQKEMEKALKRKETKKKKEERKKKADEQNEINKVVNLNSTATIEDLSKEFDFNQANTDTDDDAFQDSRENIDEHEDFKFNNLDLSKARSMSAAISSKRGASFAHLSPIEPDGKKKSRSDSKSVHEKK